MLGPPPFQCTRIVKCAPPPVKNKDIGSRRWFQICEEELWEKCRRSSQRLVVTGDDEPPRVELGDYGRRTGMETWLLGMPSWRMTTATSSPTATVPGTGTLI